MCVCVCVYIHFVALCDMYSESIIPEIHSSMKIMFSLQIHWFVLGLIAMDCVMCRKQQQQQQNMSHLFTCVLVTCVSTSCRVTVNVWFVLSDTVRSTGCKQMQELTS